MSFQCQKLSKMRQDGMVKPSSSQDTEPKKHSLKTLPGVAMCLPSQLQIEKYKLDFFLQFRNLIPRNSLIQSNYQGTEEREEKGKYQL